MIFCSLIFGVIRSWIFGIFLIILFRKKDFIYSLETYREKFFFCFVYSPLMVMIGVFLVGEDGGDPIEPPFSTSGCCFKKRFISIPSILSRIFSIWFSFLFCVKVDLVLSIYKTGN